MVSVAPTLSSIGVTLDIRVQEGNEQKASSLDVGGQPRPVGGGTTGLGMGFRRRAWTEEDRARHVVERRRQYIGSLAAAILVPIMTLILFFCPFLVTSWDRSVRITWWVSALFGVYGSFIYIRKHDRIYGYHPEILCCPLNPASTIVVETADTVLPTQSGADLC